MATVPMVSFISIVQSEETEVPEAAAASCNCKRWDNSALHLSFQLESEHQVPESFCLT